MFSIKTNIPEVRGSLQRLRMLMASGQWQQEAIGIMQQARDTVASLTPRSDGAGGGPGYKGHVADGWKEHHIGGGGKDRVPLLCVVFNKKTHEIAEGIRGSAGFRVKERARLVVKRTGERKDYSLLEVLEYGSAPHEIIPVDAKTLHFRGAPSDRFPDGEIFTRHVSHPGTRPYGMVRLTRAKLVMWFRSFRDTWRARILGAWRKKS